MQLPTNDIRTVALLVVALLAMVTLAGGWHG
jgi:hypothetical protein